MSEPSPETGSEPVLATLAEDFPPRHPHPSLVPAILWTGLPLAAQLAISILLSVLLVLILQPESAADFARFNQSVLEPILVPVATISTTAIALAVTGLLFGRRLPRVLAWRHCTWQQYLLAALLTVPLGILASELANMAELLVRRVEPLWLYEFRTAGRQGLEQLNRFPLALVLFFGCLLPGLGEEIYWRGFLSRGLVARYGVVWGGLAASLLFGAVHVYPVQACGAAFLGCGLQLVFLTTRSLPAAILLHGLNNSLFFLLSRFGNGFSIRGLSASADGSVTHVPFALFATAFVSTTLLVVILLQTRTIWRLPGGRIWSPGYVTAEIPPSNLAARAESATAGVGLLLGVALSYVALCGTLVLAVD